MMLAAVITDTVADPTAAEGEAITYPSRAATPKTAHGLRDGRVDMRRDQHPAEPAACADTSSTRRWAAAIPGRNSGAACDRTA
jgi:hypothetical protein